MQDLPGVRQEDARFFRGEDSILSGPAEGVVGAARTAAMVGSDKIQKRKK